MRNPSSKRAASISIAAFVSVLHFGSTLRAAVSRNPLFTTPAGQFQESHGSATSGTDAQGGAILTNVQAGDWIKYGGFDFDSGVAGFHMESATRGGTATLEIHLDKPDGPLIGKFSHLPKTDDTQNYLAANCKIDNDQPGVRDVYLVFGGDRTAVTNVQMFVFQKATKTEGPPPDLSSRLDSSADNEPQSTRSWGMPEAGIVDDFTSDLSANWKGDGFALKNGAAYAAGNASMFAPNAYINKTDVGSEWRTMAEASLSADITAEEQDSAPGIGFASADGKQSIQVLLDFRNDVIRTQFDRAPASPMTVRTEPKFANDPKRSFHLQPHSPCRLKIVWSPYSNALMGFLSDPKQPSATPLATFRTVIDLPAARRPLLVNNGGASQFSHVVFDPAIERWNPHWEFLKTPALPLKDVCNPAVWKWKDGRYYMVWRRFGSDTYHGVAKSDDAVHWTSVNEKVMKCTGDMNVVIDPFGDGKVYCTPGGNDAPWFCSDGADGFSTWETSSKTLGDIHGHNRIQEIIDLKRYPQTKPIDFNGQSYRYVAFVEDWTHAPRPHSSVMLSNTLTDWVLASPDPVLPPRNDFWGEKGSAIGSATVLPDGDILLASCSCTNEGYTGAPEPSNVSVIVDGRQPWKIKRLATLPDAPVSRENVWYQGPNFGTAFLYEPTDDTLYYYGGFHDSSIGLMRARSFSRQFSEIKPR